MNPYANFAFFGDLVREPVSSSTTDLSMSVRDSASIRSQTWSDATDVPCDTLFCDLMVDDADEFGNLHFIVFETNDGSGVPIGYSHKYLAVYNTPEGCVPVVHMYKDKLKTFIESLTHGTDDTFYFISDPLHNYSSTNRSGKKDPKCCSVWECHDGKLYYTEYEDGHSAYDYYCTPVTDTIIVRIKQICDSIPDDIDSILDRIF